jgi:hypothetical protein
MKTSTLLKSIALAALSFAMLSSAQAQSGKITCTGTLIDVDLTARAQWPLAVIWDTNGNYACTIDRAWSGHDPLRPCNIGERCRVVGTFRKIGQTYSIKTIDRVEWIEQ